MPRARSSALRSARDGELVDRPQAMQITGCFDRYHGLCGIVCSQQTLQDVHSLTRHRQGHRLRQ